MYPADLRYFQTKLPYSHRTTSILRDYLLKNPECVQDQKITASKLMGRIEEAVSRGAAVQ
jgi:hypothetical protein